MRVHHDDPNSSRGANPKGVYEMTGPGLSLRKLRVSGAIRRCLALPEMQVTQILLSVADGALGEPGYGGMRYVQSHLNTVEDRCLA